MVIDTKRLLSKIPVNLCGQVTSGMALSGLTTLRIGGPAQLVCQIQNPSDAALFRNIAGEADIPSYVLGGGSNILADDAGFAGMVLHLANETCDRTGTCLTVGAGHGFDELIRRSLDLGLTGLEFASGIPGTLGGAIVGNAGCYGHEISEFIRELQILRSDGTLDRIGPEDCGFSYRSSDLRESGHILLAATLDLAKGDLEAAIALRDEKIADRRAKHPVDVPCAGSWFRNLPAAAPGERRRAAGVLLEAAGAKDMTEGDAAVFPRHANIIINRGRATCADTRALADRMKQAVAEKFQVDLIEEVRYLGLADG